MSSIAGAFAYLYSIGLVPVCMFIAGACFTLWTQERFEKKKRHRDREIKMTEHIYGPLHKELSSILVGLREFLSPTGVSLDGTIEDFRFGLVKEELDRRIKEFRVRLTPYPDLLSRALNETNFHTSMELGKHEIKKDVRFSVFFGNSEIFTIPMTDIIFKDKTPLDYLTERTRPYKNASIIVYVDSNSEGKFSSEHRMQQISKDILVRVREDPSVKEQREEREYLLKECASLIEAIEKEVVL